MNVTAAYKFEKTPEGYRAVRQGDLQIYGFGLKPGDKRSFAQQGIYTVLQAKFGKLFASEIKLQGFKFNSGKLAAAGQLVPQEIIAQGRLDRDRVSPRPVTISSPRTASSRSRRHRCPPPSGRRAE